MDLFAQNTPDSFRTKLAQPISLRGMYEVALSEFSMPGRFFTIQSGYNDEYFSDEEITKNESTLLPELHLHVSGTTDLESGITAAFKKVYNTTPPLLSMVKDRKTLIIKLFPPWGLEIPIESKQLLKAMDRTERYYVEPPDKPKVIYVTNNYQIPSENFENQIIKLWASKPIVKNRYEIVLKNPENIKVLDNINKIIRETAGENLVTFEADLEEKSVTIHLKNNVHMLMDKALCPKLMEALNIQTNSILIEKEMTFPLTLVRNLIGEKFHVITHVVFQKTHTITEREVCKILPGMYRSSEDFFKNIIKVKLKELPNAKVELIVPDKMTITFGEKLKEMLGFVNSTFTSGNYISDYILELSAGITEVYVYSDIIESSLLGHTFAPILKIVPIANEKSDQIVKYFSVPLYFKVKKQHFDTIKIELRTSRGTPIQFISGKTSLVLNFRKRNL